MPYVRDGRARPRTNGGRIEVARFGFGAARHSARDAAQSLTSLGDDLITMQAAVQRAAAAGRTAGRNWLRVRNAITGVQQCLDALEADVIPLLTPRVTS